MMVFLFAAVVFITKLPLTVSTVYTNQKWQYKAQNTCDSSKFYLACHFLPELDCVAQTLLKYKCELKLNWHLNLLEMYTELIYT